MKKYLWFILALLVMLSSAIGGYYLQLIISPPASPDHTTEAPTHETVIGEPRPDFALPDPAGDMRTISDWDGDILAINFWATWCAPCKDEIPEFVELQKKYRDQGVTFVGVAIDSNAAVTEFIDRYGMNYPVLIGEQAAIDAAEAYGNRIGALPYTAFVDRSGRISHVHRGRLPKPEAEAILQHLAGPAG